MDIPSTIFSTVAGLPLLSASSELSSSYSISLKYALKYSASPSASKTLCVNVLHLEDGLTLKGLAEEHGVSKASISNWVSQFREECQTNEEAKADYDYMKENLRLRKELAELQKENDFLKKAAAFFAKEID